MAARATRRDDATARPDGRDPDTSKYPGGGSTTGSDHPAQDQDQKGGAGRARGPRPPARADRGRTRPRGG
jgi:hypothetical protein